VMYGRPIRSMLSAAVRRPRTKETAVFTWRTKPGLVIAVASLVGLICGSIDGFYW
jgi:hypothetical protein